jgi:hypothetical protein
VQTYSTTWLKVGNGPYVPIEKPTLPPLIEELLLSIAVDALSVIVPWVMEAQLGD